MESKKEILQQTVKVKQVARITNLIIEIPASINEAYIKRDAIASVSTLKENGKFSIIYEFNTQP